MATITGSNSNDNNTWQGWPWEVFYQQLNGSGSADSMYGKAGSDLMRGNGGADNMYGDLNANGSMDWFTFAGDDTMHGGAGNDSIWGNDGNDTLYGDADQDRLYGGNGNDILHGGTHADQLCGGDGNDELYGDAINATGYVDTLDGGDGSDYLSGRAGDDQLYGGRGDDRLVGGAGKDYLTGIGIFDQIRVDGVGLFSETDTYWGGGGSDTFSVSGFSGSYLDKAIIKDWNVGGAQDKLEVESASNIRVYQASAVNTMAVFHATVSNGGTTEDLLAVITSSTLSGQALRDNILANLV